MTEVYCTGKSVTCCHLSMRDCRHIRRDIKPSNIVLNVESDGGVKVLMIDFSSAVDADSLTGGLYGATGPTLAEASEQYLPPESIFGSGNPAYSATQPMSYDVWSIGVIWLEILLGTADVFTVDQRTLAMLNYRMRDSNPKLLDTAVLLAAMADYCIYRPDGRSAQGFSESSTYGEYTDVFGDDNKIENILNMFSRRVSPVRCSVDQMAQAIQSRDPLGMGFHDSWGLDLLYRMLSFSPSSRISLRDALEHAYFKGPHESTFDGSLHGTPRDAQVHDCSLDASRSLIKCVEGSVLHSEMRISFSNVASQITDLDLVFGTILEQSRIVNGRDLAVATPLSDSCGMIEPGQSRSIAEESNRRSSALLRIDGLDISRSRIRNEFLDFIAPLSTDIRGLISIDHTQYSTELEQPICPVSTAGNDVVASSMALSQGASTGDFAVGFSAANYHEDVSPVQDDPVLNNIDFKCPKCGRIFNGSYQSCLLHVKHRKHGTRCVYHTNTVTFPECISEHAMLPIDPSSGWCDLQGRRMKMEDTHAVAFSDIIPYKYFGVFDGHFGHHASHFAAEHLQPYFEDALLHGLRRKSPINETNEKLVSPCGLNIEVATSLLWQESFLVRDLDTVVISANEFESGMVSSDLTVADVKNALFLAFKSLHSFFLDYSKSIGDNSGTTATVALLFPQHIAISHVGDSRAVLCCGENRAAIALTLDHTPAAESERLRVEQAGGYVSKDKGGHIYRVNGKLAVTRSVGDREFEDGTISHLPDILFLNRPNRHAALNRRRREIISSQHHIYSSCYNKISASESVHSFPTYDFLILASDGLWDVISNDEAVQFVCDYLHLQMQIHINSTSSVQDDFLSESILYVTSQYLPVDAIHNAARELSLEAYVRGSSDNIGVCIVEID